MHSAPGYERVNKLCSIFVPILHVAIVNWGALSVRLQAGKTFGSLNCLFLSFATRNLSQQVVRNHKERACEASEDLRHERVR
jgi:hypothetical protein